MPIVFTGLAQDVCASLMQALTSTSRVRVLSAEDALSAAPSRAQGRRVVWFYRAPWSLPKTEEPVAGETTAEKLLSHWLKQHRSLLRKRRSLGSQLLLVNADRVDFQALLESLGLQQTAAQFPADQHDAGADRALNALLAKVFESSFAEHWDVFEALEALAWRPAQPSAGEAMAEAASDSAILDLFQSLLDARLHAQGTAHAARAQARQADQEVQALRAELESVRREAQEQMARAARLDEARQARDRLEAEVATLRQDSERHLQQLRQVQKQLEDAYLAYRDQLAAGERRQAELAGELGRAQAALSSRLDEVAALTAAQARLQQEKDTAQAAVATRDRDLEAARHDITQARGEAAAQVQALQRDLQAEQAAAKRSAEAVAAAEKALAQTRGEAAAQAQALQRDLQAEQAAAKRAAEALAAAEAALAQAREEAAHAQALGQENELLMQQMEQLQEEVESRFLENRWLQDDMDQARVSMDRARLLVIRLLRDSRAGDAQAAAPATPREVAAPGVLEPSL